MIYSSNNHSISLGKLYCNLMLNGIKAWQVFIWSYFGILLTNWNKTTHNNMPRRYTDADEAAGCFSVFFFHHVLTALVLYLLFTRSSSAAHHVVKNINEISLNSIFAPYGFAEAVAPLKQSAVPSGHCGFCPSPVWVPPPPPPPPCFHLLPQHAAPVREQSHKTSWGCL